MKLLNVFARLSIASALFCSVSIPLTRSASAAAPAFSAGPSLPTPANDAAAIRANNGTIFVMGGSNGNVSAEVMSLASGAATWAKAPRLDQERIGMGVGLLPGGNIAVFGGQNKSTRLASAISYNPGVNNNNTTALAPMSTPRNNLGYATDPAGNFYAVGGLTNGGTTSLVEVYSPISKTWTTRAPLPEPLSSVAAVADGGDFIYAFGGLTASGTQSYSSYRYSISADRWNQLGPVMIVPCNSSNAAALGPDDKIWLICGNYVQAYHIVGDFWTLEAGGAMFGHPAVVLDNQGRLVTIGGQTGTQTSKATLVSTPVAEPIGLPRFINANQFGFGVLANAPFAYRALTEGMPHPTFSVVAGPDGLAIDPIGGVVTWLPTLSQLGNNAVTIRATNANGSTDLTFTIGVIGPVLPTPSAPIASEIGETSLRLSWDPVASAVNPVSYTVYKQPIPVCSGRGVCNYIAYTTTTATSVVVTGLVPGDTKGFYIIASAGGNQSPPSNRVFYTTQQPSPATALVASNITPSAVTLSWQATAGPIPATTYRVYENGILLIDNVVGQTATVTGLATGSFHVFEIRAVDANGLESFRSSNPFLQIQTLFPPVISHVRVLGLEDVVAVVGEPMMIIAATTPRTSSVGANYVVTATGSPAAAFSIVSGPADLSVDPATGVVSWTPAAGQPLGPTSVTVRAANSVGFSDLTFTVTVYAAGSDLLIPTIVPTYQTLTDVTSTGASFTWVPATDNKGVVGYNIYVQTPPTNCGRGVGCSGGPIVKAGVAGPDASFTINGLLPNTNYAIWFEPFDAAGNVANTQMGRVLPLLRFTTLP